MHWLIKVQYHDCIRDTTPLASLANLLDSLNLRQKHWSGCG